MQQNNRTILQYHIQAATFYELGNFDKVYGQLTSCSDLAKKSIKILEDLLIQADTCKNNVILAKENVREDQQAFKSNQLKIIEVQNEIDKCKRDQETNQNNA